MVTGRHVPRHCSKPVSLLNLACNPRGICVGAHTQGDVPHWPWSQADGAAGLGALNLAYLAPSQLAVALGYPGDTYPAASLTPSKLSGAAWGLSAYYGEAGAAASGGPSGGGAGGPAEGPPAAGNRAASSSSDNCMFEAEAPGGEA